MTAWGANWLDPDLLPVRVLLVGLMFASLLMSVAIGDAFGERAWLFVTGYLVVLLPARRGDRRRGGRGRRRRGGGRVVGHVDAGAPCARADRDSVGDELAIAHPGDDATPGFTLLTFGGAALFLLAQVVFLRAALGHVPRSRSLGLAALTVLAAATAPLTLIVGIAATSAVLLSVAVADTVREGIHQVPNTAD